MSSARPSSLFAGWLLANALFSALSGALILILHTGLPGFLGAGQPRHFLALGAGLVLYGAHLAWLAKRSVGRARVLAIVLGDVTWVLASAALLASDWLTRAGDLVVGGVALVIAVFAVGQWTAYRRSRASHSPRSPSPDSLH